MLATIALFGAMLALNEWLFTGFEFAPGINWVYLPAGARLLCTLLFEEAGAVGLLIVSWFVSFLVFFPGEFERPFVGGILASAAPYLVYVAARYFYGLRGGLQTLTPRRLLTLAVLYSIASPLLHHLWFALRGQGDLLRGFFAMAVGDLTGTLIVLYTARLALNLVARAAQRAT